MMELLRILLTEIPRASPARQREQTAKARLRALIGKTVRGSGFGKADNQREIAVGLRKE
jgi:hypothetical protein